MLEDKKENGIQPTTGRFITMYLFVDQFRSISNLHLEQLEVGSQIHMCIDHKEQALSLDNIARLTGHLPIMMTKF